MSDHNVDLASLLCSRLCHDLLSPVGAMNNGLELLADENDPEMQKRCMELLVESATSAANKLKFFRLAFGAAGGFGPSLDPKEAKAVIEAMLRKDRTELQWAVPDALMPKNAVKILLNLALIANEAMVRGGTLQIGVEVRETETETEIVVGGTGPKVIFDENIKAALLGEFDSTKIDSRTAAAWMVYDLSKQGDGMVQFNQSDDENFVIGAIAKTIQI